MLHENPNNYYTENIIYIMHTPLKHRSNFDYSPQSYSRMMFFLGSGGSRDGWRFYFVKYCGLVPLSKSVGLPPLFYHFLLSLKFFE